MSFLSQQELEQLGLRHCGANVRISRRAAVYNASNISIAENVRIDDFCVLSSGSGGIEIGSFVHIGVQSFLLGDGRITLGDYSGLSGRVSVYSSSDDYSGGSLTNPTVPEEFRHVCTEQVSIGRHAIIGAGSVILPGARIGDGVAIGALSLVRGDCAAFTVYSGIPARRVNERQRRLLDLEAMHKTSVMSHRD
jgi:acetyltransferase-like isoleucine patch superfamily enzyme